MKMLFTLTLFSFAAMAQNLYPRLIVFPNQVQVHVDNFNLSDYRCSGFIYARTIKGIIDTHYYSEYIYGRRNSFRVFYTRNFTDSYLTASDNINCYKVNI